MTGIPRELLDAFTREDGRRPAAVLISFPEHDDPALTVRGVTSLWRSADGLRVTADVVVLQDDTYVEGGGGGVAGRGSPVRRERRHRPGVSRRV